MLFPFTLQSSSTFEPLHGQASHITVTLSIDGGTFAPATNAVSEVGDTYYTIDLTTSELTCTNFVLLNISCSGAITRQFIYKKDASPAEIWSYNGGRTVTNSIPTVSEIQSGIAKSSELTSLLAHGDSAWSTATGFAVPGSAMTLTSDYNAAKTASQLTSSDIPTVEQIQAGLSTFNASTDTVTINSQQASTMVTADVSSLATSAGLAALQTHGDATWSTADTSTLATSTALSTVGSNVTLIKAKTDNIPTAPASTSDVTGAVTTLKSYGDSNWATATGFATTADVWNYSNRSLTVAPSSLTAQQVWEYAGGRTITNTIPTVAEIQNGLAKTPELEKVFSVCAHWTMTNTTLTTYNSSGSTLQTFNLTRDASGNITSISEVSND